MRCYILCVVWAVSFLLHFQDHKPNDPQEYARILAAGGFVRVHGVPRVNGNLALSRAIGDKYERPAMSCKCGVFE